MPVTLCIQINAPFHNMSQDSVVSIATGNGLTGCLRQFSNVYVIRAK
jgi:hypothetical protein